MKPQTIKAKKVGKYVVLSNGEIWNMDWRGTGVIKKAKQIKDKDGYLCFKFNRKMCKAHRFVAECFIPNPNSLPEVNHINEIKTDNGVENLEWCNHKYNMNYGTRNERDAKAKSKTVYQYTKDGVFVAEYLSAHEVERLFGYSQSHISACCCGKQKTAYGYIWSYQQL